MHKALPRLFLIVFTLSLTGGCGAVNEFFNNARIPFLSGEGRKLAQPRAPRAYPGGGEAAGQLDIEVLRSGRGIVLENRTVAAYPNAELWLNQEYGAPVEQVAVGRNDRISLANFTNRYAEPYPTAKFLQPDADRPLVLAELLIDGKVYKLPVRLTDDWRRP